MSTTTASSSSSFHRARALHVASRVGASLLGGYAFVAGFVSLGTALAVAAGMTYGDGHALLQMVGYIVFVVAFCWAFAARSVLWVWLTLGGGGTTMLLCAWWLAPRLV